MYTAGSIVATEAQRLITTGAVSGRGHVASRPGQAPNNDTGDLANGIIVRQLAPLRVEIVATAAHSAALELGTSKIAERPYMRPAADATRLLVKQLVSKAARRAIRRHMQRT